MHAAIDVKKLAGMAVAVGVMVALMLPASPLSAASVPQPPAPVGKKKLLLFAKNPSTWAIAGNGGRGTLLYRETGGAFSLTASGLQRQSAYALVRYADAPPAVDVLARGTSSEQGTLQLAGAWRNWTKKFWLVSGDDVVGSVGSSGSLRAWRPERYLFEEKQLGVPCNCPEPEEP